MSAPAIKIGDKTIGEDFPAYFIADISANHDGSLDRAKELIHLAARATDDTRREGPDHPFSMTPATWREMVDRTRELELALGSAAKEVADNERDTVIVQRRCLRAARDLPAGTMLKEEMLEALRPAPATAIFPYDLERVVGLRLSEPLHAGQHLEWTSLQKP